MARLLTVEDVAERIGYSKDSVWRLIRAGRIKARRVAEGSPWRVSEADLEAFIESLETNQAAS